ncbi:MAG TPA: hypothetical protein VFE20_00790, partial [Thermoleophilia bacterium]|nr:hypothetical protein [Thermoleophilia bacterium]
PFQRRDNVRARLHEAWPDDAAKYVIGSTAGSFGKQILPRNAIEVRLCCLIDVPNFYHAPAVIQERSAFLYVRGKEPGHVR